MTDLKKQKASLRRKYLEIRRGLDPELKKLYEERICTAITGSISYKYYDTVLLYAALPDEPDLTAVAEAAVKDGKRIAYPYCLPGTHDMVFRFVSSPSELVTGHYGIAEPPDGCAEFSPDEPCCSLCLVPAVAVDRRGYRIGYGGGYYDRFLSAFRGSLAAVTFSCLVTDAVPHGKYDLKTDVIITEGGILTVDKAQA